MDLCWKSSGFADFENRVDRGSAVVFDVDSGLCLSFIWVLGPKRNLDHRSFFSLDRYVNEFIQITSFFERSSFKLRCETVIGIVLCCCHQASCLHYYLGEINSGIHMYQFTFEPLHFRVVSDLNKKLEKKDTDRRICIPLFTPLIERNNTLTCRAAMQIYWNKRKCYIRKEFKSHRIGLVQQHGKCFIGLKHQYGCP